MALFTEMYGFPLTICRGTRPPKEARALLAEIKAAAGTERTSAFYRAGVHLALGEPQAQ